MIIDSLGIEFGYELIQVLPYAYYLHKNGELTKTISAKHTKDLYFFSPEHEEKYGVRKWSNQSIINKTFPIRNIHVPNLPVDKWITPPIKEHYKNNEFVYEKPTFVICNKYNIEWGKPPINYIDVPTLDEIIKTLKDKYQIIYCRPETNMIINDESDILELKDKELIREKHNDVILIDDLYENSNHEFLTLQLKIFANTDKFISLQGGTSVLTSYFGGDNIIYAIRGVELQVGSYRWYNKFSGSNITICNNYESLINKVKKNVY